MSALKNYDIFKAQRLGKGSFSTVFKGEYVGPTTPKLTTHTEVAIKVISTNKLPISTINIIEDEIKIIHIIMKNPHPNIVDCYDVIRANKEIYIVMELCDSGDLRSILRRPIREKYVQFFFSQLSSGLQHLETHGIVHRDIKPRNILLTNSRRILKIADFGFAKTSEDTIMFETICGSPLYMAPEIMKRNSYNNQTDLWSIGMMLFEMLFGFHPFQDCKSIPELNKALNTRKIQIPPPNTKNITVSDECLDLLHKLLQVDVKFRITWKQFFNHEWLTVYQKAVPIPQQEPEQYNETLCSMSLGSLPSRQLPPIVEVKDDYIVIDQTASSDEEDFGNNDMQFDMEMNEEGSMSIRSVIDKSSVLEKVAPDTHHYEIVD